MSASAGPAPAASSEAYPEIDSSDQSHLLDPAPSSSPSASSRLLGAVRRHKWPLSLLLIFLLILLGHVLAVYFIYLRCDSTLNECATLKVMSLNTWGMPKFFGSQYKTERIEAIGREIGKGHYDLYLLEELWMEPDYETIRSHLAPGYFMTGFRELALPTCDGHAGPEFCSGLSVVSRLPFHQVHFESYTEHGDALKAWIDGEWLARKGVGRVRLVLPEAENATVDVFVTHTAADPPPGHGYDNAWYRNKQVKELMDVYVGKSEADVVLLAGDFNAGPDNKPGEPYHMIRQLMKNCIEEIFYKLDAWLKPQHATYGNARNTFSNMFDPIIYDYIFHKTNCQRTRVWTNWFEMPFFRTLLHGADKDEEISFSDHEAVTSTIHIWR